MSRACRGLFSWTWPAWEKGCGVGLEIPLKNQQLMLGSRWGAVLSTGAAQMPLKQSEHQLSWDTDTRWSLPILSHPQPLHLLSHSLRVITLDTWWAHDGCWETRTEIWHDCFTGFSDNRLSQIPSYNNSFYAVLYADMK